MLLSLPSELLLSILRHLSLPDLVTCILTCKAFKAVIDDCESTVYRQAAAHPSLRLIPHDKILFSELVHLGLVSSRFLGEAKTWKQLCRRAYDVRQSWLGRGPSRTKSLHNHHQNVHRIKVDEERGFFITTHGSQAIFQFGVFNPDSGGLVVADITDGTPMWTMDSPRIRSHAHCEYAEGFLVFDRYNGMKEIWRLVSDDPDLRAPEPCEVVPQSQLDERQLSQEHIFSAPGSRFKFVPHALIRPVDDIQTNAYRLCYPTLMSAGGGCLFMWDVRTGKLVERMNGIDSQSPAPLGTHHLNPPDDDHMLDGIRYVDVNDKYAFVCGRRCMKVFRRHSHPDSSPTATQSSSSDGPPTACCVMALFQSDLKREGKWAYEAQYVEGYELPLGFSLPESPKSEASTLDGLEDSRDELPNEDDNGRVAESEEGGREERPGDTQIYLAPGRWRHPEKVVVTHTLGFHYPPLSPRPNVGDGFDQPCVAIHVSPCGEHLAILGPQGRLLIIPYFERVINRRIEDITDIMIDVQLNFSYSNSESIYLAYEHGRIAVVTSWGLYIIHPSFPAPDDFDTYPGIHIQRVATLNNSNILREVSCLQMTSTAVWLNWHVELTPNGSVSSDYPTQIKSEQLYQQATEEFDGHARSSTVVSVDFGLGS